MSLDSCVQLGGASLSGHYQRVLLDARLVVVKTGTQAVMCIADTSIRDTRLVDLALDVVGDAHELTALVVSKVRVGGVRFHGAPRGLGIDGQGVHRYRSEPGDRSRRRRHARGRGRERARRQPRERPRRQGSPTPASAWLPSAWSATGAWTCWSTTPAPAAPLEDLTDEDWQEQWELHVMGPMRLMKACTPRHERAGRRGADRERLLVRGQAAVPHQRRLLVTKAPLSLSRTFADAWAGRRAGERPGRRGVHSLWMDEGGLADQVAERNERDELCLPGGQEPAAAAAPRRRSPRRSSSCARRRPRT